MSMINYASREINCKLVYYGPGLGGKTTNLEHVYNKVAPGAKGKMISLATETERTLFFDFLPVDLGTIRGFKTRFHLYTVPGQVYYNASRKLILKGVDGVVFVADSQIERMEANIEAMQNLYDNMAEHGYDLTRNIRGTRATADVPIIMITSRTAEKHRSMAFELGVNEYLGKPYQEDELLRLLKKYVKERTAA